MQTPEEFAISVWDEIGADYAPTGGMARTAAMIAARDAEIRRDEREACAAMLDGHKALVPIAQATRARTPVSPAAGEHRLPHRDDPATWPAKVRWTASRNQCCRID